MKGIYLLIMIITMPTTIYLTILLLSYFLLPNIEKEGNIEENIKIAVLIPAHNERLYIERCIKSIKDSYQNGDRVDIVVIADNCTDDTKERALSFGAKVLVRNNLEKKGKGYALNYAFENLKDYNLYIIIDADTVVSKSFLIDMIHGYKSGYEVMQGGYFVKNRVTSRNSLMNLALLIFHGVRPSAKEKLGLSVGIFGNGFALSKKVIEKVPYDTFSIVEDLEYHLKLIKNRFKVHYIEEAKVYADFPISKSGQKSQRARWEGGRIFLFRSYFKNLMFEIFKGKFYLLEVLLELLIIPISNYFLISTLLILGAYKFYTLYVYILLFLYVITSMYKFGDKKDLYSLIFFPYYLLWKILNMPFILLYSKKDSSWNRTKRD